MSLKSYLKGIADAIRNKKGTTDTINAQNFASEIDSIRTVRTLVMNRDCRYLFFDYTYLTDARLNSYNLDMSYATNMQDMLDGCTNITTIPQWDTSNVEIMDSTFYNCANLITVPALNTSKVTNMTYMFLNCTKLTTIQSIDLISCTEGGTSIVMNCKKLTNLVMKNIRINVQVGSGTSYGHLLTLDSLIGLCQECINVGSSRTLTVGTANLTKLADIYVKRTGEAEEDSSNPKIPMVQCESTDDGAMTISEYMKLKNWTLA